MDVPKGFETSPIRSTDGMVMAVAEGRGSATIGDRLNSLSGGRLTGFMSAARKEESKKEAGGDAGKSDSQNMKDSSGAKDEAQKVES